MGKYLRGIGIVLILILLASSGCGANPEVQVVEISKNTVVYDEIIRINNCGGKGESAQTATREFATSIEFGAEVSAGYQSVVQGTLSAKYSEYRNTSKSQRLVAPPATNMEFVLRWSDDVRAGNVQVNGKTGTYEVRIPISVEQISSRDLGCGLVTPIQPTLPSFQNPTQVPQLVPPVQGSSSLATQQPMPTTLPQAVGGYIPKSPEEAAALFGGPPASAWKQCPGEPLGCWTFALPGTSYRLSVPENCLRADGSIDSWRYGGGYGGAPDEIQGKTRIWNNIEAATIRCH